MTINKKILERFRITYKTYYKKDPIISKSESSINKYYVKGIETCLSYPIMKNLSMFYEYRIVKNKTPNDPFTNEDFEHLSNCINEKWMSRFSVGIALGVSPFVFQNYYKDTLSVEESYSLAKAHIGKSVRGTITWKGRTETVMDWAEEIGVEVSAFRKRKRIHGVCDLIFMTVEEYRQIPKTDKPIIKTPVKYVPDILTEENKRVKKDDYEACCNLIAGIIADAKGNLISGRTSDNSNTYFQDSQRFLMNRNGQLQYYLEVITRLNVSSSLKELYKFATEDYKQLQSVETKTNQVKYLKVLEKRKEITVKLMRQSNEQSCSASI